MTSIAGGEPSQRSISSGKLLPAQRITTMPPSLRRRARRSSMMAAVCVGDAVSATVIIPTASATVAAVPPEALRLRKPCRIALILLGNTVNEQRLLGLSKRSSRTSHIVRRSGDCQIPTELTQSLLMFSQHFRQRREPNIHRARPCICRFPMLVIGSSDHLVAALRGDAHLERQSGWEWGGRVEAKAALPRLWCQSR